MLAHFRRGSTRVVPSRTRTVVSDALGRNSPVCQQLAEIKDLVARVSTVNSKSRKASIIAEYPQLRDLLEHVYDPKLRLHTTSTTVASLASLANSTAGSPYSTISALFDALSSRAITGNSAKEAIENFLGHHGIAKDPELLHVFLKLVDRNLTAGFASNTLQEVPWPDALPRPTASSTPNQPVAHSLSSSLSRSLDKFSLALGKTILVEDFPKLFSGKNAGEWYASRKLDGVRCLLVVDFRVNTNGRVVITNMAPLSRAGNTFSSLAMLEQEIRAYLPGFLQQSSWVRNPMFHAADGSGSRRLVLDGEVCVMRERRLEEKLHLAVPATSASTIDTDDNLIEDFAATVSMIKRKDFTIPHPVFFVLDVIPSKTFDGLDSTTFAQRINDGMELVRYFNVAAQVDGKQQVLRELVQWKVVDIPQLESMVERAAKEGWEGLVIRKDVPYEGKRTSSIRKFKQWQEAEYTVVDLECRTMRLAINGVFEDRLACSNVLIEHKGTRVSVGSGFSVDQRLRYAADPSQIIGKQITLEYFAESTSTDRGGETGGVSLRFPRVKAVWEDGNRNI